MLDVCSSLSHECASGVCIVFLMHCKDQAVTLCFQKLLVKGTRGRNYNSAVVQVVPRSLRAKASAVKLLVEKLQLPRGSTCCPCALNAHMLCVHGCGEQPRVQNILVLYLRCCSSTWHLLFSVCVCLYTETYTSAENCMFQYTCKCVYIYTHTLSVP